MNRYCLNRLISDKGVSVTEVMVTLIILSLIMIVLFRLGSSLIPALETERQEILTVRQERVIREVLSREFSHIRPPWWLPSYEIAVTDNTWEFPWYGGKQGENLTLTMGEGTLILNSTSGSSMVIGGADSMTFSLLSTAKGTPVLVMAEWENNQNRVMYFPLGSRIVPPAGLP
jgi:hypothetical protein